MICVSILISGKPLSFQRPRDRLVPANDSATLLRADPEDLRQQEYAILANLAAGDVDERSMLSELNLVRRSMLATGHHGVLRTA